jgi:hypothetical protein
MSCKSQLLDLLTDDMVFAAPALPLDRFLATKSSRPTRTFIVHTGAFVSRTPLVRVSVGYTTLFGSRTAWAISPFGQFELRRQGEVVTYIGASAHAVVLRLQEVWYERGVGMNC